MLIWGYQFHTENNKTLKRSHVGHKKRSVFICPNIALSSVSECKHLYTTIYNVAILSTSEEICQIFYKKKLQV